MGNAIMQFFQSQANNPVGIELNFQDAAPATDEEREIHSTVGAVLNKAQGILDRLTNYTGCEEFIRKAITTPSPTSEEEAWNEVLPAVDQLKEFYDYSLELQDCFPKLLLALCKDDPRSNLASQQSLAKQLAEVFDFILRFDELKMGNPAIQNDFSYYRRTLNRLKLSKKDLNISIRDELANRMSLFFAYPTPMMNVINEITVKFLNQSEQGVPKENVTGALAFMANICQEMIDLGKCANETIKMFCLRCMTGSIILYDHLHTLGAFNKKSPIRIKPCILTLKQSPGGTTDGLLNALRFTTVHLNDPDTPANIKHLLD
mmetsp:Transcript_7644/g.12215  ORF Transcript_7644/g.12215 Transcript_7644/m.12215 type:complete len:318 (-) Transcript_7644:122-1075(-)|eukprot:CAMPEP_0184653342 /NCGR_PEP_ID=MMETSP0308-20130426/11049_1 /TAXON_ID=38269 /ORGANISM="Gloeochaete witrockiana, Strain SAG 46.84" /LENGTH=317 /DNA_ID=CAMNT_0027088723 /DNA_START=67 /DNA_END=1020 /DNA_ORIENTATION=+